MKTLNAFHLKITALISMITDHIGLMFFPDYGAFRIVGRAAFILYSFMLAEGYFHTKNRQRYLGKLFLWAVISEIPFDFALYGKWFYPQHQNIFFTLFLSAMGIHLLEKYKEDYFKVIIPAIILFIGLIFRVDYSIYGILIIWVFYLYKKYGFNYILPITLLSISAGLFLNKFQFFAPLGFIPILLYSGQQGIKTGNIYYSFYALHLLIFGMIKPLCFI